MHDFQACSSEILYLHNSRFMQRAQEHNSGDKWEPPAVFYKQILFYFWTLIT